MAETRSETLLEEATVCEVDDTLGLRLDKLKETLTNQNAEINKQFADILEALQFYFNLDKINHSSESMEETEVETKSISNIQATDLILESEFVEAESIHEEENNTTELMQQHAANQIEALENEVSISLLEPSHRVEELKSVLIKNNSLQSRTCCTLDDLHHELNVDFWSDPNVEQVYILDVEEVEELTPKSVDASIARQVFDSMPLRTQVLQNLRNKTFSKTWWFKFKEFDVRQEDLHSVLLDFLQMSAIETRYSSSFKLVCAIREHDKIFTMSRAVSMRCSPGLMSGRLLQTSLVTQQVMRNTQIKFSKRWWFKYKSVNEVIQRLLTSSSGKTSYFALWHCIDHESNRTDSHLWHGWKNRTELARNFSTYYVVFVSVSRFSQASIVNRKCAEMVLWTSLYHNDREIDANTEIQGLFEYGSKLKLVIASDSSPFGMGIQIDLITQYLAELFCLRFRNKRKQMKYHKNWRFEYKFKYKQKPFLRILIDSEQHQFMGRKMIMCKMRLRQILWDMSQYSCGNKKTQRKIKSKFKLLSLMDQSYRSGLMYKLNRLEISGERRIFYVDVQFFLKHKWRIHNDSDFKFCGKCKTEQKHDKFTISFGQIKKKNQSIIDADIEIQAVLEMVFSKCNVLEDSPKSVSEHERLDLVVLNQIEAFNRLEDQIGVLSKLIMALRSYLWLYLQHLIAMKSICHKFEKLITRRELLRKETIRVVHYTAVHMIMDREIHTC